MTDWERKLGSSVIQVRYLLIIYIIKTKFNCLISDDTIGDLKKLIAAQTGTRWDKIVLKKWYVIYKDHITLEDYEIHDGMNLELYYQ